MNNPAISKTPNLKKRPVMQLKTIIITLFVCLLFASCCRKESIDNSNDYPSVIVEKKLQKEYDFGKWVVYCSNYRQTDMFFWDDEAHGEVRSRWSPVYFNLILDDATVIEDTTVLKYSFCIHDTIRCFSIKPNLYVNTVVFVKNSPVSIYRFYTEYEGAFPLNVNVKSMIAYHNRKDMIDARKLLYPYSDVEKEFIHYLEENPNIYEYNKWLIEYKNKGQYSGFDKYVIL